MNRHIFFSFLGFVLLISTILTKAQGVSESVASNFENFYKNNYQETIFIHADKDYYLTGEFVKFKVYCLEKLTQQPSKLSKVAYVEILDHENNPQLQARIELKEGSGYGEFYIPMDIQSGNFFMRGYTRWMRNYGPETYYHTMVQIINPFRKLGLMPVTEYPGIEFYPEGGKLIHGVETNMVFHGKNELGIPEDVEGRLMANDTVLITEFSALRNGLGHFSFTPDLMQKYHVELKHGDEYLAHDFIPVQSRGLSMQVKRNRNSYEMDVFCNETSIIEPSGNFSVVIFQNGEILFNRPIQLSKGKAHLEINEALVQGIVTMTILDAENAVLAERKLFRNIRSSAQEHQLLAQDEFVHREKVDLRLPELAETADISISVSASNKALAGHMLGLNEYLLLDNSIKYLYGLETYLEGQPEEVETLVNDLLIAYPVAPKDEIFGTETQKMKFVPEHRSVLVTGSLTDKQTKEPGFGILTYLSVPGKITQIYAAKSDVDGHLVFESGNFYGGNQVVVQNDYTKDSIYNIEIDNPYSTQYADIPLPVFDLSEQLGNLIRRKSQQMQVQNTNIKLTPNTTIISARDSASFYIKPDSKYFLDDYTRFVVMEEVMREYISGVNVRKNKDGFHFMVIDIERNLVYEDDPLMLLDGVPVFDADEIMAIDPLKIEKIETVKTRFGRGVLDCKGIVTYTSYAGDLAGYKIHKNASVFDYDGLQPVKSYLFPTYANASERKNTTPDFRSNLYWNPTFTNEKSKSEGIGFFTSDDTDSYKVVINGINEHGEAFSLTDTFEVRRQKID